jgi:hypothetical protein
MTAETKDGIASVELLCRGVVLIASLLVRQVKIGAFCFHLRRRSSYGPCESRHSPECGEGENVQRKVGAKGNQAAEASSSYPLQSASRYFIGVKKYPKQKYGFLFCDRLTYEPSAVVADYRKSHTDLYMHSFVGVRSEFVVLLR